jgi:hypothetical protein
MPESGRRQPPTIALLYDDVNRGLCSAMVRFENRSTQVSLDQYARFRHPDHARTALKGDD